MSNTEPAFPVGSLRLWIDTLEGITPGEFVTLEGVVRARRRDGDAPQVWQVDVVLAGSRDRERFGVELPRGATIPIGVGDRVRVRARLTMLGVHPAWDATLERDGALLAAVTETGDVATLAGWDVAVAEAVAPPRSSAPGLASRVEHWVALSHRAGGGGAVRVHGGRWARLPAAGGAWLATADATSWTPGALPPDAGDARAFAVLWQPEVGAEEQRRRRAGAYRGGVPADWPALVDAAYEACRENLADVGERVAEVDAAGNVGMELWGLVRDWAECLAVLGPRACATAFAPLEALVPAVLRDLGALDPEEVAKGPDAAHTLLSFSTLARASGFAVPPDATALEAAVARMLVARRKLFTDRELHETAFCALASGAFDALAELTGAVLPAFVPGATFQVDSLGFARYLAAAIAQRAPAEGAQPAFEEWVRCFPLKLGARMAHYTTLWHAARAFECGLAGRSGPAAAAALDALTAGEGAAGTA